MVYEAILIEYFGEVFEGTSGESGPLQTCSCKDDNANSLLLQVANDFELYKPDPCDGCADLTFADDGFATESSFQATAAFIGGSTYYSLATTGFGDDLASISALAERIYNDVNG